MNFKKTTLKNGLRIIIVPAKSNPAVTVLVMVETGSNYETKEQNGLSHFLEHMCFKGTTKRPKSIDISRELDALGAQSNAFTSNEFTGYYAKGEKNHVSKLIDVVSDMYLNPTLPAVELEKERGVIIQEISMYEDLPQRRVQEFFAELLYGDTPAGRSIAGPVANIKKFQRKDFVDYRTKHYVAEKTIVIVAGDIAEKKVIQQITSAFKNISTAKKLLPPPVKEKQTTPAILVHKKKTDQTHIVLGVRAFDVFDKRMSALQVLAGVLSGGMSGRLFQKLREEMGACYYARANAEISNDHGSFIISTGVEEKRVEEVIKVLLEECKRLCNELVSKEELQKTKDYMSGHLYLGLETSDALAEFYVVQEALKGEMKTPAQAEKEIRAVTAKDVQNVARDIFKNKNLNLAIVGNIADSKKLKKILSF
jgi:predicted Zn-dependent peptidase